MKPVWRDDILPYLSLFPLDTQKYGKRFEKFTLG